MDEKPCYADVQSFVERHCSGRRYCRIKLTNDNLKLFPSNCSVYSPKSLEIEYKCIDVYSSENKSCALHQSLLVTTSSGYLANIVTDETGQGSQLCPWRFQPRPGHTVHLTLLDFEVWLDRAERDRRNICRIYAIIKEMGEEHQTKDTLVCGGLEREKFIMSTDTEITIAMMKQEPTVNDTAYFFIKYQASTAVLTADPTIDLTSDPSVVLTADRTIVVTSLAMSLVASLSVAAIIGFICHKRHKRGSTEKAEETNEEPVDYENVTTHQNPTIGDSQAATYNYGVNVFDQSITVSLHKHRHCWKDADQAKNLITCL